MKHITSKKALSLLLSLIMIVASLPMALAISPADFVDFPMGWSKEAVTSAVENGLLNGRTANTIEPRGKLTRAEMATIINRAFGATVEADVSGYTDLEVGSWYYHEIAKAVNMETFQGDGDATMRPNATITREEVFAVIARALVLETNDYSSLDKFQDKDSVSSWAKTYAAILAAKGYVNGDDNGDLNPRSDITREEFAQIMHNIIKTYYVTPGAYNHVGFDSALIRTGGVRLENVTIDGDLILGDGVGAGDVELVNVTIRGRLLARGGEGRVTLTRTTVGERVVVKDVNGVVNFYNYRTEAPFKNIWEITKATFRKHSSSGNNGYVDNNATVTFYDGAIADDSLIINTAEVIKDTAMTQDAIDSALAGFTPWVENGYVDGTYVHQIYPELWYEKADGTWAIFDNTVVVEDDMNVYYAFKKLSLYLDLNLGSISKSVTFSVPYETDTRIMDSVKDALTLGRNQVKTAVSANAALGKGDYYEQALAKAAEKVSFMDAQGNLKYLDVDIALHEIIETSEVEAEIKVYLENLFKENTDDDKINSLVHLAWEGGLSQNDEFVKKIVAKVVAANLGITLEEVPADVLQQEIATYVYNYADIKAYLNDCTEADRIALADSFFDGMHQLTFYQEFVDKYDAEHDEFHITHESADLIMALASAVNDYTYDELADRIENKFGAFIDIMGEDVMRGLLRSAQDRYYADAVEVWADVHAHEDDASYESQYPSYLTFKLDVIEHIVKKVYPANREKAINKFMTVDIYHYNENTYLQQLIAETELNALLDTLFVTVPKVGENIGYAFYPANGTESGFMHYYDYMLEMVKLFDKAMLWYKDNLTPAEMEELKAQMFRDAAKAANKANEMLEAYEQDGELPLSIDIDKLKEIEAFAKLYDKVEDKIVKALDKYKTTSFYGKEWNETNIRTDIPYVEQAVSTLLGLDDPTFNIDSFMDLKAIFDKAGFTDYNYTGDTEAGTVTVQAIEKTLKGNIAKINRYYQ